MSKPITVKICCGYACSQQFGEENLKRASRILGINVGETTSDGSLRLEKSACIGHCNSAPNVMFQGQSPLANLLGQSEVHHKILPNKLEELLLKKLS